MTHSLVDSDVLETLYHRASFLLKPGKTRLNIYLFAKTGFTEQHKKEAEALRYITLVTAKELFDS